MRLWQKIFVSTFLVFILAFDTGVYILTSYSYNFNLQRETDSCVREHEVLLSTIQNSMTFAEQLQGSEDGSKTYIAAVISSLAYYYGSRGVYLALYDGDTSVFSNLPDTDAQLMDPEPGSRTLLNKKSEGVRYLSVSAAVPGYENMLLIYSRDIRSLDEYRSAISRFFILINAAITAALCILIALILRAIMRPLRVMNKATAEIAGGAYDKRVAIRRRDELGELAGQFNAMADSVEKNVALLTEEAESRQRFIEDLSHEMKTPLTAILGYSDYLQRASAAEEDRLTAAEHLNTAARQLSSLSRRLMDMLYLKDETVAFTEVNAEALLSSLRQIMEPSLSPRGIALETLAETNSLLGDESLLLSLLTNLTENAARASQAGQTVTVRAYRTEHPVLEVSDSGRGMRPEDAEKVCEPFYRVDKARSRAEGGVGLGLSIVREIARLHSAEMKITSEPGRGTTVRVIFTSP